MDAVANFGFSSLQSMKGLCQMLRNNADRILSGEMSITITSDTLYQLNEAVDNLQDGLSPPNLSLDVGGNGQPRTNRVMDLEEWNLYLQLVLDIVSKAPVLVLYRDKNSRETSSTSNSQSESPSLGARPVRLGYFTSLNHLEINHVPIKSIQDLLKMRERLETLVVMNCTDRNFHLQDVLEMCDQEISVPMQWAVLTHLCLRCNHLMELDGSLRLCPRLEMLDLSRNRLATTDVYLGYLMELTYVDLSYNCLSALPSFSATAKKKLKILLLAGNKIMDLTGIEEMTSLQQLDISENLICTHHCLFPVRSLHRLDVLNMRGCPASMVKNHRLLALQYISSVSLSRQFCLDRRQVTHKEIQNSRAVMSHSDHHHRRHHSARPSPAVQRMDDGVSHMARNFEERPSTAEGLAVGVTSSRKKKSRKKAKARTMDIQDMDSATGGDLSSRDVTPSTTPKAPSRMEALAQLRRAELQETRTEMEHLRRYYGDSWLQAVEDKGILHPSSIINATDATAAGRSQTSRKSGTESAVKESAAAEVEVHSGRKAAEKSVRGRKVEGGPAAAGLEGGQRSGVTGQETGERAFNKESMFLSSESGAEDGGTNDLSTHTGDNTTTQEDHGNEAGPLREAEEVKNDGKFSAQGQPSPDSTIIEPDPHARHFFSEDETQTSESSP